ncbi:MAG: FAD-binding protein [Candidatus Eisenbacteria bacterium]|nr:FAD-binding protein [Candidatus Latescibacterota bacterium]MBD3301876.1 FAD-binding protein [Candidatus Eisenbacteria bacterium]
MWPSFFRPDSLGIEGGSLEESRFWSVEPSVREAYAEDASGLIGSPDAVARPTSEEEVAEIVRLCADRSIPVTPQGLRSSTVGGPVAFGGLALNLERLNRTIDIDMERRLAIIEPGVVLGEFKRPLIDAGLFYPPDPTSENECTVGGSVLTNASGSRTYQYGPTRRYVRSLRLVLGDGRTTEITRSRASKNTAGYFGFQDPVDLLCGSEGTLGIVTRVTLDLLPAPPGFIAGMAFFLRLGDALGFVVSADRARQAGLLEPRCLELFDDASLDLIRPHAGKLGIPGVAKTAIFFEQECEPDEESIVLDGWLDLLERARALAEDTIIATTEEQFLELRELRHALPSEMNERGRRARDSGGGKLSTDWAVPIEALAATVEDATRIAGETFGGPFVRYGHIGNGHPHFNLLAENAEMLARAREATHRMAMLAVERGGTITAEHGIGKIKRDYLRYQYPDWVVQAMRAVKRTVDPKGILAPGNIFG